jgi:hypothetical protein
MSDKFGKGLAGLGGRINSKKINMKGSTVKYKTARKGKEHASSELSLI